MNGVSLFSFVRLDDFEFKVLQEKQPVLLACMRKDYLYQEQLEVLKIVSETFGETVRICLMHEDQLGAFMQKFGIEGTPTFLVFNNGKVVDEMLGKADDSTLHAFISPHVPSL